ncbi:DNA-binding protein [Nocardiopsis salina]|uniref:DNA-binding protein n=1 Tax=Nocardiopsis salina TaxID=245836 RepID=UPI000349BB00|nr:DNA-binding protein [Nocardiopsis salina]
MTATRGPHTSPTPRRPTEHEISLYGAWEQFVQGENEIRGVRPEVAISWQRSRDQYNVDPYLSEAPVAVSEVAHSLEHDVVFTELGFRAASMAHEVAGLGGIVTVADANGRLLAEWGDKQTRAVAAGVGLAPWYCWSERAVGTNGMGTALAAQSVVVVRREEHWCQAFHDWSCAGAAVRDAVTKDPIAVLNISCRRGDLPASAATWLGNAATHTQRRLRMRARDGGAELLAAFNHGRGLSRAPLAAVDTAGKVVIADDRVAALLGVPADSPAVDPVVRWNPQLPELIRAARYATQRAGRDSDWVGSTQICTHLADEPSPIGIRPVFQCGSLVGHLISFTASDGEQVPATDPAPRPPAGQEPPQPRRVVGMRENRMVLLRHPEVTLAEAEGSDVWLTTDQGRMQAASSSLDKLDHDLAYTGFLRVHRRYVVNLNRIREVERRDKGELFLVMDDPENTMVPVSRRNTRAVRQALGI